MASRVAVATRTGKDPKQDAHGRGFWIALAAPGMIWLILLFVVPFYAVLAIAMGQLNRLYETPIAVWNPLHWSSANVINVWHDLVGATSFAGPIVIRTIVYVAIGSLLCLVIGYPAAYFVARFAGRRKGLFLLLLIAPFWISYMMRMLAWVGLLQTDGYVNKALSALGLISQPVNWLGGKPVTVILGLVYGYIPYLILVLFAGLDRIDPALIEAGRDLGLGRARTFLRVTLPLSRQPILTGAADHRAADDRRLLHQPADVRRREHVHDRQPHRRANWARPACRGRARCCPCCCCSCCWSR